MNDVEWLHQRVVSRREKLRRQQKERYELAKQMGYTPEEAIVLQSWSLKRLLALPKR